MTRTQSILTRTGWSERRLAEWLGVAQPTVNRLKAGQPESGPVAKLLDQLESDLAAGRIVADAAEPSTAVQAQGFASAHGGA